MKRQARIEVFTNAEVRYYAHGFKGMHGRKTKATAYKDAARRLYAERYPCECEPEVGAWCGHHPDRHPYAQRVVDRLVRWLLWRDSRLA